MFETHELLSWYLHGCKVCHVLCSDLLVNHLGENSAVLVSHAAGNHWILEHIYLSSTEIIKYIIYLYEPKCQKTCLPGLKPGLTQTGLYSHRRWLEAWNFQFRKQTDCTIYVAKTKALISCVVTMQLICVFLKMHIDRLERNSRVLVSHAAGTHWILMHIYLSSTEINKDIHYPIPTPDDFAVNTMKFKLTHSTMV